MFEAVIEGAATNLSESKALEISLESSSIELVKMLYSVCFIFIQLLSLLFLLAMGVLLSI